MVLLAWADSGYSNKEEMEYIYKKKKQILKVKKLKAKGQSGK